MRRRAPRASSGRNARAVPLCPLAANGPRRAPREAAGRCSQPATAAGGEAARASARGPAGPPGRNSSRHGLRTAHDQLSARGSPTVGGRLACAEWLDSSIRCCCGASAIRLTSLSARIVTCASSARSGRSVGMSGAMLRARASPECCAQPAVYFGSFLARAAQSARHHARAPRHAARRRCGECSGAATGTRGRRAPPLPTARAARLLLSGLRRTSVSSENRQNQFDPCYS